jgi:hypothetical protein
MSKPTLNVTDFEIKKLKIQLPYQLRTHRNFGTVNIRVDEDQLHFHLDNDKTGLPELWIFDGTRKSWANIEFLDPIRSQA